MRNLHGRMVRFILQHMPFDSMDCIYNIHELIKVLESHNLDQPDFIRDCYLRLIHVRGRIYDYSVRSTSLEYERCMLDLIRKLDSKIQGAIENDELFKVAEFVNGTILLDDIDKKTAQVRKTQKSQSGSAEVCMLCSAGRVSVDDSGYLNCQNCLGMYK